MGPEIIPELTSTFLLFCTSEVGGLVTEASTGLLVVLASLSVVMVLVAACCSETAAGIAVPDMMPSDVMVNVRGEPAARGLGV